MIRSITINPIIQTLYQKLTHTGSDFTITYPNTSMSFKKGSTSRYGKTVSAFELYVYKKGYYEDVERSLLVFIENKGEAFYIIKKPGTYKIIDNGDFKGRESNVYQVYFKKGETSKLYRYDPLPYDCCLPFDRSETVIQGDDEYESGDRGI